MRARQLAKLIVVASLVAAAIGLAWWVGRELRAAPPRRIVLASGVEISVLGVTYGTNHVQPGFGRFLPDPLRVMLARLMGRPSGGGYRFVTSRPEVVVWVTHNATNSAVMPSTVRVALADDSGFLSGDNPDYTTFVGVNPARPLSFGVWPRRSRELRIRVFEPGSSFNYRLAGEMRFPNPARNHAAPWTAEPLPARRTNEALVCTLSEVFTGVGMETTTTTLGDGTTRTTYSPPRHDGENSAVLQLTLTDQAQPSNNWEIAEIHVVDATGNSATNTSLSANYGPGPQRAYDFKPALWVPEPWRLELLAARRPEATFASNELVVFTNVALPAVGMTNSYSDVESVGTTKVSLLTFHRREPLPKDSRSWTSSSSSELKLLVADLPAGAKFTLVRATDDSGTRLEVPSWGWGNSEPHDGTYSFSRLPAEARTLNLVFAVQTMRRFTFVVQPALATTNDLSPSSR